MPKAMRTWWSFVQMRIRRQGIQATYPAIRQFVLVRRYRLITMQSCDIERVSTIGTCEGDRVTAKVRRDA